MQQATTPLVVDLDGSLIRSDTTDDQFALCMRYTPHMLFYVVFKLLVARSEAKRWLAERFAQKLDPANLPYEPAVLDIIAQYRAAGQPIELLSGADNILVQKIARHLGLFDFAQGSTPSQNLVSEHKASLARTRHGDNFAYIGNSRQDIPVWRRAKGGYGVRPPPDAGKLRRENGSPLPFNILVERRSQLPALFNAMQPRAWIWNLLLFLAPIWFGPNLAGHDLANLALALPSFCLIASATCLLNGVLDVADDR